MASEDQGPTWEMMLTGISQRMEVDYGDMIQDLTLFHDEMTKVVHRKIEVVSAEVERLRTTMRRQIDVKAALQISAAKSYSSVELRGPLVRSDVQAFSMSVSAAHPGTFRCCDITESTNWAEGVRGEVSGVMSSEEPPGRESGRPVPIARQEVVDEVGGRDDECDERVECGECGECGGCGECDAVSPPSDEELAMRAAEEYTRAVESGESLSGVGRGLTLVFAHLSGEDVRGREPTVEGIMSRFRRAERVGLEGEYESRLTGLAWEWLERPEEEGSLSEAVEGVLGRLREPGVEWRGELRRLGERVERRVRVSEALDSMLREAEEASRRMPRGTNAIVDSLEWREGTCVCPVCLDAPRRGELMPVLPCGHLVHERCLRSWMRASRTCPTCRAPVT